MIPYSNQQFITHIKRRDTPLIIRKRESNKKMYRSKLQICIEILCTLASNGPMNLTSLRNKVELDKTQLEPHLKLLKNRGLIKKQILGANKIFYAVTERGLTVIKVITPIIKEAHKIQMRDLEAISTVLSGAGY